MASKVLFFLSLFLFTQFLLALPYRKESGVINLTKENFAKEVFTSEHVWLIEFYAPWCGHCKSLQPEWEKLAKNMKGILKIGAVNGDEEKELAGHFKIQGFPTIKLFGSKIEEASDEKGRKGVSKTPIDYQGPRTAAAMANFGISKLPSFVTNVKSKDFEKFFSENSDQGKVLLFTNKKETSNLYKALSIDYHHLSVLGEVRESEKELVERFGVTKFPTVFVFPPESKGVVEEAKQYEDELKHEKLLKFLAPFAKKDETTEKKTTKAKKEEKPATPTHKVAEEIKDAATFSALLEKFPFLALGLLDPTNEDPKTVARHIELLEKMQEKHSKTFQFAWADGIYQQNLIDQLGLSSAFPSLTILSQKKLVVIPYVGSFVEENMDEFLEKALTGSVRGRMKVESIPNFIDKPIEKQEL